MREQKPTGLLTRVARMVGVIAAAGMAAAACQSANPEPHANLGEAQSAVFTNGGFETGNAGQSPPSWPVTTYSNPGITIQTPETLAGLDLAAGGNNLTEIMVSASGPLSQPDAFLGTGASLRWPRFGNQCALVNQGGKNQNVNSMAQTMTVAAGDVDPSDGQIHIRFAVAPVLENPGHAANQQPYFFVQATNVTQGNAILYSNFNFSNQTGVPWQTENANGTTYVYTDWQLVDISPGGTAINMGDSVELQIIASGCSLGGHMGQLYVDGVGSVIPGLFVSGKGPSQVNACNNITYALTYKNGGATADAGVVLTFNTPPGTTFQSISIAGCTTPAVGAAGLITCPIGTLAAGASGTFNITVNVPCGTTGTVTAGNYEIAGTGVPGLLGPVINTIVGCTADNQCTAGNWCDESADICTPTLANGQPVATDPSHMNPTLNGKCTTAAGALVCTSAVCDTDNECGYKNGDGTCTQANGSVVCRSGVCDLDGKCGYANGDGPCTSSNAATVCRSGTCSVVGLCEAPGTCDADADCAAGHWCFEQTHTCTPTEANGQPIPTDPPHMNPLLNATCTTAAGALVCTSAVCDTDNECGYKNGDGSCSAANGSVVCRSGVCDPDSKCGYANGDGPCTAGNATVVCRSGACSTNLKCEPLGGCNVDADCTSAQYCNTPTSTCVPKLPNGQPVPTVNGHTPTLNGTCTALAGASVCVSGVCDPTNNECGYANEDGPCTAANGSAVCQSGQCSTNGKCEPMNGCNVDADCTGGNWCNETAHTCAPKVANGGDVPNDPPHTNPTLSGACTVPAAILTCVSGVCDTKDNECGYANGDGPCTAGATGNGSVVCRSGACSTNGTCEPLGGCNVDTDCTGGKWCDESTHVCTAKIANGNPVANDPPHTNPTLNGTCTPAASALVCVSSVCDTKDNDCGYANGDGPCTTANGGVVCRSGACSTNGTCEPAGGCNVDGDCTTGNWCDETAHMCMPTLVNGKPIPTDPPHTSPTLNGACTTAAGALVCQSKVCDTNDNECGYANGDGPCTAGPAGNGAVVCRSGACSTNGTCEPIGGCNVDADCTGGDWCDESTHMCTAKIANGNPVANDPQHTNPTLNGTCTPAAATLVCASGVCDTDNECGYANGDGPCTAGAAGNGGTVCRSGACSTSGTCEPAGGCNVDADCTGGNWCDEAAHTCTPALANGSPVPTDPPHANPTLNGTCTTAAAALVCQSGVCDTKDNECGYANGDGPCTMANGGTVCRSGACGLNNTCIPPGGCVTDADCATGQWCDESMSACLPQLSNGTVVPSDPPHANPTLNGTCTAAAATLVCQSGVCDTKDNECGYANGDGPCSATNGGTVCRSGICGSNMVCVACAMDSQCPATAPHCNAATSTCVQCTSSAQCSGETPICDSATSTCQPCNGDQGSGTSDACGTTTAPFCFLEGSTKGACGKCATNTDCAGHAGDICDTGTGLCVSGCLVDTDCIPADWCNASGSTPGMCVPKLANGTPLPSTPSSVATCTAAVGARVCASGVCDPKDNACGLANGDGVCEASAQCRNDSCDETTMTCTQVACSVDAQCPTGDYCNPAGQCAPQLPLGATCSAADQCQSGTCQTVCTAIVGSGNGLVCSASPSRSTGEGGGAALVGLLVAAAGLSRRSRRSRSSLATR